MILINGKKVILDREPRSPRFIEVVDPNKKVRFFEIDMDNFKFDSTYSILDHINPSSV